MDTPNQFSTPPVQPSPSIPTPSSTGQSTQKSSFYNKKPILGFIGMVIAAGAVYMLIVNWPARELTPELLASQPGAGETDVVDTTRDKTVPEGFPSNIPVESENITQAFKINYKDVGATQYTVSFRSSANKEDVWKLYSDIMRANGFTTSTTSDQSTGLLLGEKWDDEFSVSINEFGTAYLVTINYIERENE